MKTGILTASFLILFCTGNAQRYIVKEGMVDFFSEAPLENIRAESQKIHSIFNSSTAQIAFRINISDFKFSKKLMQEHFNEKYMESEKYPDATFSGTLDGFSPDQKGIQQVIARGNLKIHGVTKQVGIPGTVNLTGETINMEAVFPIRLKDYNITIPQLLWKNIAEEVKVTIKVKYIKN